MSRRQRVTTALLLAPLPVLALLLLPTPWLAALVAAVLLAGLWEWTAFAGLSDTLPRIAFLAANALLIAALAWGAGPSLFPLKLLALLGVLWWLAVVLWVLHPGFADGEGQGAGALKLLAGSLAVVPAWCALVWLHAGELGPRWALFAIALVWAADSGAYFAGSKFGRRKLAPAVSPNKSWEGVWGGLTACALLAVLGFGLLGLGWRQLPALVLLVLLAAVASVVGDLLESLMKRHSGLKDSGRIFPGHGGVMDRLDSLLAALPVFAVGKAWLGL
ncbi:phosphatidate cytidylyltransferase [Arenimonas fontis]|uniref:Phosphatidate cytidylyltransferase n=1 Tax=Arenimonas fontis TaxID=2608255 RepID=A0A5B2ZG63_9GAMM|nr:phosphatidate cytidylyltransferase [Arenimonas fontis]KAA2286250.1 phosphatidate cytidylyltransferase [Arenimonas fontis]